MMTLAYKAGDEVQAVAGVTHKRWLPATITRLDAKKEDMYWVQIEGNPAPTPRWGSELLPMPPHGRLCGCKRFAGAHNRCRYCNLDWVAPVPREAPPNDQQETK